jgi:4-aminobutyrate aminotransferase-like enzyme
LAHSVEHGMRAESMHHCALADSMNWHQVIEHEALVQNIRTVGAFLETNLRQLQAKYRADTVPHGILCRM